MENVRSSQPCISMNFCTEFNTARKFFHVGIVKFTLWKTLFREWFLTNSYIQVKNMATSLWEPRSDLSLKDAASSTGGITWGIVNYLRKRKKLILAWSITYEMNENFHWQFLLSLRPLCLIVFSSVCIFTRHCEIIDRYFNVVFVVIQLKKEKVLFGHQSFAAQTGIPVFQTAWIRHWKALWLRAL